MKRLQTLSDEELAVEYVGGNNKAFDLLLTRNQSKLYGYITFMVKDHEVADDVFQDTFVKAIVSLQEGRYKPNGKFSAWLQRIAHNLVMDHFRNTKADMSVDMGDQNDMSRIGNDMVDGNIENRYVNQQVLQDVKKLMNQLPESQREVVYMRMYQNMAFKDIAAITNCSINTALGRMRYGIMNMRRMAAESRMSLNLAE